MCSYTTGHDTQDHTSHESDSQMESVCVSDVASAFLNTPIDESKGFIHVQAPPEIQVPRTNRLDAQASAIRSQRFTEIMAGSFESSSQKS